ncbi:hypothetical protein CoNPh15_CDS0096 [Staphylococcus phage S-CoN_Ph15]|nr:hypothetical protein CoNPh14_CDS0076 [Staphylococcus phage S-CoN_Ph14]WNM53942.1 hypothetical protein CoNPh15_CDS0096 [Staphylococcus phage S-CoN_Ph15]WNM54098.1 hypothetical protein CoNPh16_CDS0083 [Staphylococcus phage S-CoN_Ph16]
MATKKQIKYVQGLQKEYGLRNDEIYKANEINRMTHLEIGQIIDYYRTEIDNERAYNECLETGLPNQQ